MSLYKKYATEFIGVFILIISIIGTGYLSFDILSIIYNSSVCTIFFVVISVMLSAVYYYIVHRLYSKIL